LGLQALQEFFYLLEPFGEALDDLQADYESIGMVVPAYLDLLNKTTLARNQVESRSNCHRLHGFLLFSLCFVMGRSVKLVTFSPLANEKIICTACYKLTVR